MTARFEISTGDNGTYYFILFADNEEQVLKSAEFSSMGECESAIAAIRANSHISTHFYRVVTLAGKYYYEIKSIDGRMIAGGQTYDSPSEMESQIAAVIANSASAPVVVLA